MKKQPKVAEHDLVVKKFSKDTVLLSNHLNDKELSMSRSKVERRER